MTEEKALRIVRFMTGMLFYIADGLASPFYISTGMKFKSKISLHFSRFININVWFHMNSRGNTICFDESYKTKQIISFLSYLPIRLVVFL